MPAKKAVRRSKPSPAGPPARATAARASAARATRGAPAPRRPAAATRRAAARPRARAADLLPYAITLNLAGGDPVVVRPRATLQRAAMQWRYIVRNRARWTGAGKRDELAARGEALMNDLGFDDEALDRVAAARVVEVGIPYASEASGWEARIFPWEYLLSAATRRRRGGARLTVMRRLEVRGARPAARAARRRPVVLFVESAPAGLRDDYDFDAERTLVARHLGEPRVLVDPTPERLAEAVRRHRPDAVHLAGFDVHQAARLLGDGGRAPFQTEGDGYVLAGPRGGAVAVPPAMLAGILCGGHRPRLVGCNFWNTGARVCPMLVAAGAGTVLGFADDTEDSLAELFFASAYRVWSAGRGDPLEAFGHAWKVVREQPKRHTGSGFVMWNARPAVTRASDPEGLEGRWARREPVPAPKDSAAAARALGIEVEPLEELNYSLLHNNRALFEGFVLRNFTPGALRDVTVDVELHAGADCYPYRSRLELPHAVTDLGGEIRVPLTSRLARNVREEMHTTLAWRVAWNGIELERRTRRVTLLPVDEWRDNDEDRIWLPSFVLPRDPAVERAVHGAQRYLKAIQDDPAAGFDGYQAFDRGEPRARESVDRQVQAIWSALLHDRPLDYINPPPGYAEDSQRIRPPGEVLEGGQGTCIELALLFAACLELVGIHPVVFLLEGHAFPGYWSDSNAYEEFLTLQVPEDGGTWEAGDRGQRVAWSFERDLHREILSWVRRGALVPVETVALTSGEGLAAAREQGRDNLADAEEFHSMMDVELARAAGVTPLPRGEAGA